MKNKFSKKTKTLVLLGSVLTLLFVTLMIYYFGATYPEFQKLSQKEFKIPGLETSFVPQGIEYDQTNDKFIVCGYMNNGSASRFYVIDGQTGETEKYFTLTSNLEDYKGHAGGLAINYPYAWVSNENVIYRFNLENALLTENGQKIEVIDYVETLNAGSFVDIIDGKLVVGEFYKKNKYPTNEAHHLKVEGGTNKALQLVYEIDHTKNVGLGNLLYGISTTSQVQGMAETKEGKLVLSTSYSIPSSKIYVYENPLSQAPTKQVEINGKQLDVYVLDQTNLENTIKAPSMSEEMVLVNDRVYVLFESACKKYRFVNRTRIRNVYSLDI